MTNSFIGSISGILVPANHEPSEQLANVIPNSRIDLDVERHANQHRQKTCFELFHWEHPSRRISNAITPSPARANRSLTV
jgi:hypothetical protein